MCKSAFPFSDGEARPTDLGAARRLCECCAPRKSAWKKSNEVPTPLTIVDHDSSNATAPTTLSAHQAQP